MAILMDTIITTATPGTVAGTAGISAAGTIPGTTGTMVSTMTGTAPGIPVAGTIPGMAPAITMAGTIPGTDLAITTIITVDTIPVDIIPAEAGAAEPIIPCSTAVVHLHSPSDHATTGPAVQVLTAILRQALHTVQAVPAA